MIENNWIYTKDLIPCPNERVFLCIVDKFNKEHYAFGTWNEHFYETQIGDKDSNEVVAWMKIKSPILSENEKLELLAENYAMKRTDYELEYARTLSESIGKNELINWIKEHTFISVKKAFVDGFNAKL